MLIDKIDFCLLNRRGIALVACCVGLSLLSGCLAPPTPLTVAEQKALQVARKKDQEREEAKTRRGDVDPITAPITLEEALARAIKYNLDYRLIITEEALRVEQANMAQLEMLPKLAANAGWNARNEDNLSISKNTRTGATTTDPFVSQDSTLRTADLTLTWNLLDFGVSYYQAKQSADQVMIAQERRRRVINQIAQQVRAAYWRAATAEPLCAQLVPLIKEARQALADARIVEEKRLSPPLEILYYQKGLVEVLRDLEFLERDLTIAKTELATLMGLPPGTPFTLAEVSADALQVPTVSLAMEAMEELALANRPELREEGYQRRISANETKKALLRMLPGLTLSGSVNYDSNSYLVNEDWAEIGAYVTWNLMNLVTGPAAMRTAKTQEALGEVRSHAVAVATLTQLHVGYQEYLRAQQAYERAQLLGEIESRIFKHIENAAINKAQTPLQRIRAQLTALFAESARFRSYAELQNAVANLHVTMGGSPFPEQGEALELQPLKSSIKVNLAKLNSAQEQPKPLVPRAAPTATQTLAPPPAASKSLEVSREENRSTLSAAPPLAPAMNATPAATATATATTAKTEPLPPSPQKPVAQPANGGTGSNTVVIGILAPINDPKVERYSREITSRLGHGIRILHFSQEKLLSQWYKLRMVDLAVIPTGDRGDALTGDYRLLQTLPQASATTPPDVVVARRDLPSTTMNWLQQAFAGASR